MKYEHGTYACYVRDKCRCVECRAANNAKTKERRGRIEPSFVSVTPVREHIQMLLQNGYSVRRLVQTSGVSDGCVRGILYGRPRKNEPPAKRISRANYEKLMAVMPLKAPEEDAFTGKEPDIILELAEVLEKRLARDWRDEAACRNRPPYLWFPAPDDKECAEMAKKICASCLSRTQCLKENLYEPVGIYGGYSAGQRRRYRNKLKLSVEAA